MRKMKLKIIMKMGRGDNLSTIMMLIIMTMSVKT